MREQDVVKKIMKINGLTQQDMANRLGMTGQSTLSMILHSKSMKVENLVRILNECNYELIARSKDGAHPDFVIGEDDGYVSRIDMEKRMRLIAKQSISDEIRQMAKIAVAEEMQKVKSGEEPGDFELPLDCFK